MVMAKGGLCCWQIYNKSQCIRLEHYLPHLRAKKKVLEKKNWNGMHFDHIFSYLYNVCFICLHLSVSHTKWSSSIESKMKFANVLYIYERDSDVLGLVAIWSRTETPSKASGTGVIVVIVHFHVICNVVLIFYISRKFVVGNHCRVDQNALHLLSHFECSST